MLMLILALKYSPAKHKIWISQNSLWDQIQRTSL